MVGLPSQRSLLPLGATSEPSFPPPVFSRLLHSYLPLLPLSLLARDVDKCMDRLYLLPPFHSCVFPKTPCNTQESFAISAARRCEACVFFCAQTDPADRSGEFPLIRRRPALEEALDSRPWGRLKDACSSGPRLRLGSTAQKQSSADAHESLKISAKYMRESTQGRQNEVVSGTEAKRRRETSKTGNTGQ